MKFFHSAMPGAPVLTTAAGSLRDLLNACLVDGFGLKSITGMTVAGGVATVTVVAPHAFVVGTVAEVAGVSPAGLNGQVRVTEVTATTIKFATTVPDGPVSGTATIKVASLGWLKSFTGTNKAVYRSAAVESAKFYLRVNDATAGYARVVGYEAMTTVDAGTRPFPTNTQVSGGLYWSKCMAGQANKWALFGDERIFYICVDPFSAPESYGDRMQCTAFGEPTAFKAGDAFCTIITGCMGDRSVGGEVEGCVARSAGSTTPTNTNGCFVARSHTGTGASVPYAPLGVAAHNSSNAYAGGGTYGYGNYPNSPDGGLLLSDALGYESGYRFSMPGVKHLIQNAVGALSALQTVDGSGDMLGRKVMIIPVGSVSYASPQGVTSFDITGPWR